MCFQLTSTVTCFSGLSLISIILWEYWENTIKTFWYYYKNKRIISWKIIIFFFFWDYSKRSHQSDYIYYHKNMRENKLISSVETWLYRPLYYVLNFTRSSHIVNSRMVLLSTHAQNNKRTYTRKDFVGIHRYKTKFYNKNKKENGAHFNF